MLGLTVDVTALRMVVPAHGDVCKSTLFAIVFSRLNFSHGSERMLLSTFQDKKRSHDITVEKKTNRGGIC